MEILSPEIQYDFPVCIALGFFDCIHMGHRVLIDTAIAQARSTGSKSCVVTFSVNPFIALGTGEKLVFTYDERLRILRDTGVDCVLALPFDGEFMQKSRDEFLAMLRSCVTLRGVVCGYDYRFGHNAQGTSEYLCDFCAKNGIMCDVISPIIQNGLRISGTEVRRRISCGDIEGACKLLGRAYFMDGAVCHGRGVGKVFDFPTANLDCPPDKLLPQAGVYATITTVGEKSYRSVTNVGAKPTFGEWDETVETMLIGFDGNLYGQTIRVTFVRWLRGIRKFDSPCALREQIEKDSEWR